MEIVINQDIRKFKSKDIGNFSFKEAGFIVGAGVIGYGTYFVQKLLEVETISFEICIIPAIIPLVFGFFKPFGMTFYEFLKTVVTEYFLTPKEYRWESDFVYDYETYGELYGDEYALSDERLSQLKEVEGLTNDIGKPTKEEKLLIIK